MLSQEQLASGLDALSVSTGVAGGKNAAADEASTAMAEEGAGAEAAGGEEGPLDSLLASEAEVGGRLARSNAHQVSYFGHVVSISWHDVANHHCCRIISRRQMSAPRPS